MSGRFRRAIRILAEPGVARAEVEDDFHHFAVAIRHDGGGVTEARGRAIRHPWSLCPMARDALPSLRGLPVTTDPTAVYRHVDPRLQCTHMLELAALAVTQAARGPGARRYDATVGDPIDGRVGAELSCDGATVVRWSLEGGIIVEPAERRGQRPAAYRSAVLADLPHEEAERLLILRRVIGLGTARGMDIDQFPTAANMDRGAACFVFRPGVAEHAARNYGSERDFSTGPGPLSAAATFGDLP
jgi:hypothetical protein